MAKRRFQAPEPERSGRWWYLRYWRDSFVGGSLIRKRTRRKLAPASLPQREAQKLAAEFLRPLNQGLEALGSATLFHDHVRTYNTTMLPLMAKSTRDRYQGIIRNYLEPAFGSSALRELTPLTLQQYFSALNPELSYESRDKIRDVLSSILKSAVTFGLLVKNPAEGIRLAAARKGTRIKPFVDPGKFDALIELIPEPYGTMVYVAVLTGLRPSELIGLKWKNVGADSISVTEKCCRGDWGKPKSKASNATIPVDPCVIERIHRLKTLTIQIKAGNAIRRYPAVKAAGPDDLVFQPPMGGPAMRDNNILIRFIKPAGRKLDMPWLNWQALRRSHATWLKLVGADVKDAQAQMRHARVTTTLEIYQQFVPDSQRRVVNRLHELTEAGREEREESLSQSCPKPVPIN